MVTLGIAALLVAAIGLGGCARPAERPSRMEPSQPDDLEEPRVNVTMDGSCMDQEEVERTIYKTLNLLCEGRGYRVVEQSPHAFECRNDFFETDVTAMCRGSGPLSWRAGE